MFKPVPLNTGQRAPQCFLNGPAAVLCVDDERQRSRAWVIDVPSGRESYSGPTDLRTFGASLRVKQIGIYAVADTSDQGIYGVGAKAETTWFVPGDGRRSTVICRMILRHRPSRLRQVWDARPIAWWYSALPMAMCSNRLCPKAQVPVRLRYIQEDLPSKFSMTV